MKSFITNNKKFISYALIFMIITPILGLNFFIGFIGNILLLLFLIPLLILLIVFIGINSLKSKINTCNECGAISLGVSDECYSCGANLTKININNNSTGGNPSERTIEIKAEEIK